MGARSLAQTALMLASLDAVDLSRVTPSEVAVLKQRHFWFGCTVEQAQLTWRRELPGLRAVVTLSEGNGGQPVLVLVPAGFDVSRPFVVQTHFHGDFTAVGAPGGVHTQRLRELLEVEWQRAWVLPEAQGRVGQRGTDWDNVKDHAGLVRDALAAVGVVSGEDTRFVVSAHSSGGRALAAVVENGTLRAQQLVLLDCLYERSDGGPGTFTTLLTAAKRGGLARVEDVVIVASGSYPAERDAALLVALGGRGRLEPLVKQEGLADHAAAARNHLVPRAQPLRGASE